MSAKQPENHLEALIDALRVISLREYEIPLEHSYVALDVVVTRIEAINTVAAHESVMPLRKLMVSISDLLRGGKSVHFNVKKKRDGRPKDKSFALLQGAIAGAMQVLMSIPSKPMSPLDAAIYVADGAMKLGLRDQLNKRITAEQVTSWRYRAGGDLPLSASEVYDRIAKIQPKNKQEAQNLVSGILLAASTGGLATGKNSE
jgi:hypothetical protein